MMYNTNKLFAIFIVGVFLVLPFFVFAARGIPEILHYQGRLLNASGSLLGGSGTSHCFRFSIYNASTDGTKLWPSGTPSTMTVNVKEGVFNVGVGDTSAGGDTLDFNFQDNDTIYLQVDVAAQSGGSCSGVSFDALTPRLQMVASGFAINTGTVAGTGQSGIGTTTFTSPAVLTVEATSTTAVSAIIRGFKDSTADLLRIITAAKNRLLTFTSGGFLGIGTSTPAETFSVNGGAFFDSDIIRFGTSSAPTLNFKYFTSSTSTIPDLRKNVFSFATSTTAIPFFSLDSLNYRIGIGTTTPGKTLSVHGTLAVEGNATSTFGSGLTIARGGLNFALPSCSGSNALTTDAGGGVICSAITGSGGNPPNLIYRTLSTTKYYTASTSASDNLAFHFNNGFVSSASSTIAGALTLEGAITNNASATSTFSGGISVGSGGLASSKGISLTGGVIQTSGAILSSASATSTFSSGGISAGGGGLASSKGISITGGTSRLGTIVSGTWQGTGVGAIYGGTGQTTYTTGDLLYSDATNSLAKRAVGTRGQILSVSTGGTPAWIATSTFAHLNAANAFTNTGTSTFSGGILASGFESTNGLSISDGILRIGGTGTTTIYGDTATSTFDGGINIVAGGIDINLTSCTQALETDAGGAIICGTDDGALIPNLIYRTLSTTKYYTASTSASDNLAFHFNNGFVSSASSTIAGTLTVTSSATSTFNGGAGILAGGFESTNGLAISDGILRIGGTGTTTIYGDSATSTFSGGVSADAFATNLPSCSGSNALNTNASGAIVCGAVTAGGDTIVEKDADESFTSSSTMAHDTDLKFTMTANTAYRIKINAWFKTNATADFKYGVSVGDAPSAATLKFLGQAITASTTAALCVVTKDSACTLTSTSVNDSIVELEGIAAPGASGAVFHFDRAQNTSNSGATSIEKNSFIAYAALTGTADLAEIYMSTDSSLVPGEVMVIDPLLAKGIKRSSMPYEQSLIGVVSTNPALLIGADSAGEGYPTPVALAGRVPVKVTSENGPIEPGDFLTSSSIPGVAMKAIKAGAVFGQALSGYDGAQGETGTVEVFVENTYIQGSLSSFADSLEGETNITQDEGRSLLGKLVAYQQSETTHQNISEIFTDRIGAGLEIISPRVITDTLVVNAIEPVNKDVTLKLMEDGLFVLGRIASSTLSMSFGESASSSPITAVSIDALGNAFFDGSLIAIGGATIGSPERPSGITFYDTETKEPYCVQMRRGALV
ncbi:MAG: hypothetical protein AAB604_02645, partial [Patescibacteria group bacterium]